MSDYKKIVILHESLHISKLIKKENAPFLLFIHGGPGMNSGTLERFIIEDNIFNTLNYNIILYDQRSCGKSLHTDSTVTHQDNIDDLLEVISTLDDNKITLCAIMGHSYGAKLLYDFYSANKCNIPGIFISTASSTITPRINNLLLDINYLKRTNETLYLDTLKKTEKLTIENLWEISEELAPLFFNNTERMLHYWANLDKMRRNQEIQSSINLPINKTVFQSVREELYSQNVDNKIEISKLETQTLWINGLQDHIINSFETLTNAKVTLFQKSSHYPHIEESERFCSVVNQFISTAQI